MPVIPVPVPLRDRLITEFRRFICDRIKFVPFTHQAAWWATTDGRAGWAWWLRSVGEASPCAVPVTGASPGVW